MLVDIGGGSIVFSRNAVIGMALFVTLGANASASADNDAEVIRKSDIEWSNSAQSKDVDTWVAHYSIDAVVLSPNQPAASGKEAIRKTIGGLLGLPGLSLSWRPLKVEVARSGDIGYLHGTYELSFDNPNGGRIEDRGKYVEVWKKQPDGSWKCAIDMFNSDLPASQ